MASCMRCKGGRKLKLIQIIKIAFKNIISNKLRSILTMLGLVIGISSVIALVGIGNGSSSEVKTQVQALGTDILTIAITSTENSLSYEKLEEIKELSNIKEGHSNSSPTRNNNIRFFFF